MRRNELILAAFLALAALPAGTAGAEATSISFSGIVTANNSFVNTPPIGSTITGRFTFDPANTGGEGLNCTGIPNCWSGATSSWVWNGVTISTAPSVLVVPSLFKIVISLSNSVPGAGPDIYEVRLGGYSLTAISLTLTDSTGTAFESAANPLLPPWETFDSTRFNVVPFCASGISCAGNPYHSGTLTSWTSGPAIIPPPTLDSAKSRKSHGAAGVFDLTLAPTPGNPTTEARAAGSGVAHTVVFTFDKAVIGGTGFMTSGVGFALAPSFSGNDMIVPLFAVADGQYVTIAVLGVASADGGTGGTGSARIGFLAGDANQSRAVTLADLLVVNTTLAQPVTASNFLRDVNVSGTLTLADILRANASLSKVLPAP